MILRAKKTNKGTLTTLDSILTSAIAGAATSILSNPIWVVNVSEQILCVALSVEHIRLPFADSPLSD